MSSQKKIGVTLKWSLSLVSVVVIYTLFSPLPFVKFRCSDKTVGLTESEQVSPLVSKEVHGICGLLGVLLLHLSSPRVLEPHYEMDLGGRPTSVWPKHDGIGGLVLKLW